MKHKLFLSIFLMSAIRISAQDLLAEMDKLPQPKDYTIATFKATRLVNFHTIETLSKGSLEVRISHRFGAISGGSTNFWGLDGPASIQLRIDYAVTDL